VMILIIPSNDGLVGQREVFRDILLLFACCYIYHPTADDIICNQILTFLAAAPAILLLV
jgi:hypothetical protein